MKKSKKFLFLVNGAPLQSDDISEYARDFNFHYSFDPTCDAGKAGEFFKRLVAANPHVEVVMYSAISFSVPQPAQIQEVK